MPNIIKTNIIVKGGGKVSLTSSLLNDLNKKRPEPSALSSYAFLLLDSSGSMSGDKWNQLKIACDRFCLMKAGAMIGAATFGTDYAVVEQNLTTIPSTILDRYNLGGSTALLGAIKITINDIKALPYLKKRIVLVTDGQPTDASAPQIIEYLQGLEEKVIIDTVGIGSGCAEHLLIKIAEITGGIYCHASVGYDLLRIMQELSPERRLIQ